MVTTGRLGAYRPLFGCWKGHTDPLALFPPFQNAVSRYGSQFQGHSQHDALEFLLWLLDRVHKDLESSCRGPVPEKVSPSAGSTLYLIFLFSLECILNSSKLHLEIQILRFPCVLAAACPALFRTPFS